MKSFLNLSMLICRTYVDKKITRTLRPIEPPSKTRPNFERNQVAAIRSPVAVGKQLVHDNVHLNTATSPQRPTNLVNSSISAPLQSISTATGNRTPKTTAQDLLANVLSNKRPGGRPRQASRASLVSSPLHTSAPLDTMTSSQPQLLFGNASGGTASRAGHSIWSASPEEGSLDARHRHHSYSGSYGPPATNSNPRVVSQPPLNMFPDVSVQVSYGSPGQSSLGVDIGFGARVKPEIGHQRVPSSTLSAHQAYSGFPSRTDAQQQHAVIPPGSRPQEPPNHKALPLMMENMNILPSTMSGLPTPYYAAGMESSDKSTSLAPTGLSGLPTAYYAAGMEFSDKRDLHAHQIPYGLQRANVQNSSIGSLNKTSYGGGNFQPQRNFGSLWSGAG
jgi:hypothetical protein